MAMSQPVDLVTLAADGAHDRRDRQAGLQNIGVASDQPLIGQRQPSEPVVLVRIDTRDIEDEVRLDTLEKALMDRLQFGEIGDVEGAVRDVDVQVVGMETA